MGLFVLASTGLSLYIWSMTLYNVYKPLSSTISAAAPSVHPLSLFTAVQDAFGAKKEDQNQPPKRQGRKRKHLTLAEAQREQLRESLKVLFVWLACKGTEPVFDYTFGYVIPFYNVLKVLSLLVFARFRAQLSIHLFDSFVIPLGRPNTPLINSTAFTTLILPWLRFMLSLPFAHLLTAFRNTLHSLLSSWGNADQVENIALSEDDRARMQRQILVDDRVPPPKMKSNIRQASTSTLRKDGRNGSGPSNGNGDVGGNGFNTTNTKLRYQRSMDSLSSLRTAPTSNRNTISAARQRSISSRMTPGTQETYHQLQSLPSVPQGLPDSSIRVEARIVSGPASHNPASNSSPMTNFAHIPSIGLPVHSDNFVLPPTGRMVSHLRPSIVEKMPGSLTSSPVRPTARLGEEALTENAADDRTILGYSIKDESENVGNDESNKLTKDSEKTLLDEAQVGGEPSTNEELALTIPSSTPSRKKVVSKRKVSEIDGNVVEGRETKTKAPLSKKSTRGTSQTKPNLTGTASASKPTKVATNKKNDDTTTTTLPRSRSKRSVAAKANEAEEEGRDASKIPRTRKGAT